MKTNALIVTNSAAASGTNDIHGIKPPVAIPLSLGWILVIVAAVVLGMAAIGVLAWWLWRKQVSQPPPPVPVIPPHVRARRKLQEALALMGQPRPFCILVSDTIRLYLEERFTFHAPERTTEEFLYELQASNLLLPEQKQSLGEFLSVCDMVKFAKYEPGPPELQALHDSAVRLVDETEPQPLSAEAAADQTMQPA
jgi:hypothetical protein